MDKTVSWLNLLMPVLIDVGNVGSNPARGYEIFVFLKDVKLFFRERIYFSYKERGTKYFSNFSQNNHCDSAIP